LVIVVSEERKPVTYALLLFSLIIMIIYVTRRPKEAVITPKPQASINALTTNAELIDETAELLRVMPIPITEAVNTLPRPQSYVFTLTLIASTKATISDSLSYLLIKVLNASTDAVRLAR